MADIQSNTIQSLSKVLESAQSGYGTNGLGTRVQANSVAKAVVLSVLSSQDQQVVLQDQASGKRISLDKQALQGAVASQLTKGDKLTLLSTNNEVASFSVEKARVGSNMTNRSANGASLGHVYSQTLAQKLATHWPDINPSVLRKISPNILNYISFDGNSQNALNTAKSLIEIANKTNHPLMEVKLSAAVKQILGNSVQLAINANNAGHLNSTMQLSLPLTPEFNQKLVQGQTISINFTANDLRNPIQSIALKANDLVSKPSLNIINKALLNDNTQLKNLLAQVLFSAKNSKASELVFTPTKDALQTLNVTVKQALLTNLQPGEIKEAQLIATQGNNKQNSNANLQLSLVAKPSLLNIDAQQLHQASLQVKLQSIVNQTSNVSAPNAQQSQVEISSLYGVQNTELKDTKGQLANGILSKMESSIQLDTLRSKLNTILNGPDKFQNIASADKQTTIIDSLQKHIKEEINHTLPKSESISKVLPMLVSLLSNFETKASGDLKTIFQSVITQITQAQSFGESTQTTGSDDEALQQISANKIKEIFTQQALPNVSTLNLIAQAIQPIGASSSQGSLINGLVTMLQASLQARLIAQQPNLLATIAQLSPTIAQANVNKAAKPHAGLSKALQDLNKLDPRGNLIGELNKVLSNHSLHKLSSAEATLQGQDSFYYALTNPFSAHDKDIEILIKREKRFKSQEENKEVQQHWQLSMKLDIGDSGDVLAKVKLVQNQLDLNMYASNQALKEKILDVLPYLNRRLVAAGLQVKPKCFLGKIPDQLYKTDYQVVQAYV